MIRLIINAPFAWGHADKFNLDIGPRAATLKCQLSGIWDCSRSDPGRRIFCNSEVENGDFAS